MGPRLYACWRMRVLCVCSCLRAHVYMSSVYVDRCQLGDDGPLRGLLHAGTEVSKLFLTDFADAGVQPAVEP